MFYVVERKVEIYNFKSIEHKSNFNEQKKPTKKRNT